ncbi:hypothetical protein ODJ79_33760 [Actinoplanes sp. KI2]|uniref:hypothetical protein n=1 Tax=Actinoplanes sp. KI2 TaxID=2983315 RepID=UPI0021D58D52|nr:hypothetical protein [Actinoplanes sp. KI2]MCU7728704.1 hypothetical protein [Actinoplanes sp. KI2]
MAVQWEKSFDTEVAKAFRFLVAELGLSGPSTGGPSAVVYTGGDVWYQVFLDPATRTVTTRVTKALGTARFTAELPALVVGAALGTADHVRCGARTLAELRNTVLNQADYVRRLQPYLTPLNVLPLMRAANAREQPLIQVSPE